MNHELEYARDRLKYPWSTLTYRDLKIKREQALNMLAACDLVERHDFPAEYQARLQAEKAERLEAWMNAEDDHVLFRTDDDEPAQELDWDLWQP